MIENQSQLAWQNHYRKEKSRLVFPDENVIRFLKGNEVPRGLLDLGCGPGRHSIVAKSMGFEVTACDFIGNELIDNHKFYREDINWVQTNVTSLPFKENSFETILCWGVLHYLDEENLQKSIKEIFRVLKPNGIFFASMRAKEDTHLSFQATQGDLTNSNHNYFSQSEVLNFFDNYGKVRQGYISRIPLGSTKVVAHHTVEVKT